MNTFILKNTFIIKVSIFVFLTFIFFLKGIIFLDPDLGWHIRAGELAQKGLFSIPDPFSYTMPSYSFIDHEWLTNMIFFMLLPLTGLPFLSLIFAYFAVFTIFLSIPKNTKLWHYTLIFLIASILLSFAGIRPQVLSWLFFVIFLKIFKSRRYLIFIPFLLLLWVNLHGGFVIGLIMLFIYTFSEIVSKKRLWIKETSIFVRKQTLFILILSALITLVNPHGILIWKEVLNQLTDPMLRRAITEWFPLIFAPNPIIILWFLISAFLLIKYRTYLSLFEKVSFIVLFLMGISSSRNTPFFILAMMPPFTTFSEEYVLDLKRKLPDLLYRKIPIAIFYLNLIIFLLSVSQIFTSAQIETSVYPDKAIFFLKQHSLKGEIFAPYNWGGYLIWQYPQKKVFIDGRMPSWKQETKVGESNYALAEYFKVFSSQSELERIFNKYHINTILWQKPSEKNSSFFKKLLNRWQNIFVISYSNEEFIKMLEKLGWKKIYSDDLAVIYERI